MAKRRKQGAGSGWRLASGRRARLAAVAAAFACVTGTGYWLGFAGGARDIAGAISEAGDAVGRERCVRSERLFNKLS